MKKLIEYIEKFYHDNDIDLKYFGFDLNKIHYVFKLAAETDLSSKTTPSSLRPYGYIKVDKDGKVYIELQSYANTCLFISNGYVKTHYRGCHLNEEEFNKIVRAINLLYYKKIKEHFPEFLKNFKNMDDPMELIVDDFKSILEEAKEFDEQRKNMGKQQDISNLIDDIEEISFMEPDSSSNNKNNNHTKTQSSITHNSVDETERYNLLLGMHPEKVIHAHGKNKGSSYLVCLYNIGKLAEEENYALVMEPSSSHAYTKTAYFKSKIGISDEQFKNISQLYLELDRQDITSLANTVRTCHKDIDRFKGTLNGLLLGEYKTPAERDRITFARETAEEIQPITYSKKK
ncbi:MAG: hypothetical protein ACI4OT_02960 [Bacilli bacterium]